MLNEVSFLNTLEYTQIPKDARNELFTNLALKQKENEIRTKGVSLLDPVFFKSENIAVLTKAVEQLRSVKIDTTDNKECIRICFKSMLSLISLGISASVFPAFFTRIVASRIRLNYSLITSVNYEITEAILSLIKLIDREKEKIFIDNAVLQCAIGNSLMYNIVDEKKSLVWEVQLTEKQAILKGFFDGGNEGTKYVEFMKNVPVAMPYVSREAAIAFLRLDFGNAILPDVYSDIVVARTVADFLVRFHMVTQHGHPLIRSLVGPFLKGACTNFNLFSMEDRDDNFDVFHSVMYLEHLSKSKEKMSKFLKFEADKLDYDNPPKGCIFRHMNKYEHYRSFWMKNSTNLNEEFRVFELCKSSEWDGICSTSVIEPEPLENIEVEDYTIFDAQYSLAYMGNFTFYGFQGDTETFRTLLTEKNMVRSEFRKGMCKNEQVNMRRIAMAEIGLSANASDAPDWFNPTSDMPGSAMAAKERKTRKRMAQNTAAANGNRKVPNTNEDSDGDNEHESGNDSGQESRHESEQGSGQEDAEDGEREEEEQEEREQELEEIETAAVPKNVQTSRKKQMACRRMGNKLPSRVYPKTTAAVTAATKKTFYNPPRQPCFDEIGRRTEFNFLSAKLREQNLVRYKQVAVMDTCTTSFARRTQQTKKRKNTAPEQTLDSVPVSKRTSPVEQLPHTDQSMIVDIPDFVVFDHGEDDDVDNDARSMECDEGSSGNNGSGNNGSGASASDPIDLDTDVLVPKQERVNIHCKVMEVRRKRGKRNPFDMFKAGLRISEAHAIIANSYMLDLDPEDVTYIVEAAYKLIDNIQKNNGAASYSTYGRVAELIKLCNIANKSGKHASMTLSDKRLFSQLTLAVAAGNGHFKVRDCCKSTSDSGLMIPELLLPSERARWYAANGGAEDYHSARNALRLAIDCLSTKKESGMNKFLEPLRRRAGVFHEDQKELVRSKMQFPGLYYDRSEQGSTVRFDTKRLRGNYESGNTGSYADDDDDRCSLSGSEAGTDTGEMDEETVKARTTVRTFRAETGFLARNDAPITAESIEKQRSLQEELNESKKLIQELNHAREELENNNKKFIQEIGELNTLKESLEKKNEEYEQEISDLKASKNRIQAEKSQAQQDLLNLVCQYFGSFGNNLKGKNFETFAKNNLGFLRHKMTNLIARGDEDMDNEKVMNEVTDGMDSNDKAFLFSGTEPVKQSSICMRMDVKEKFITERFEMNPEAYKDKVTSLIGSRHFHTLITKYKDDFKLKSYKLYNAENAKSEIPLAEVGLHVSASVLEHLTDSQFERLFDINNFMRDTNNNLQFFWNADSKMYERKLSATGKVFIRSILKSLVQKIKEQETDADSLLTELNAELVRRSENLEKSKENTRSSKRRCVGFGE